MSPINRTEAIGVFAGIAIMALALGFLRFHGTAGSNSASAALSSNNSEGAVVVAGEDTNKDLSNVKDALRQSTTNDGTLTNLVIDDVVIGSGAKVKDGDTVTVQYIGKTQDGTEFDNSYLRGQPFTFTVGDGKVIKGWDKGLVGMQVGGKRILIIPPDMAYGNRAVGPIKPNSALVFTIELRSINQ